MVLTVATHRMLSPEAPALPVMMIASVASLALTLADQAGVVLPFGTHGNGPDECGRAGHVPRRAFKSVERRFAVDGVARDDLYIERDTLVRCDGQALRGPVKE
ncbi:MAG: hypothetical protein LKM39_09595 [Chiayiivirga sp.]|nr:hypothetical protein [Chiayiivirga sp.]